MSLALAVATFLGSPASSAPLATIEVNNLTGDPTQAENITETVSWAKGRYQTAGLDLPDMTVNFRRGRGNCADMVGLWTKSSLGHRIEICIGGARRRKLVLIHEMAHAWVSAHLAEEDRDIFLDRRDLDAWTGDDTEWADRGIEQAAMVVAWGLDETCEQQNQLPNDDATSLTADYVWLTGRSPVCEVVITT